MDQTVRHSFFSIDCTCTRFGMFVIFIIYFVMDCWLQLVHIANIVIVAKIINKTSFECLTAVTYICPFLILILFVFIVSN